MDIVREGEIEATNYFFGIGDQEAVLELTFNHDGRTYELGTGYGHIALAVDDMAADARGAEGAGHRARARAVPAARGRIAALLRPRPGRVPHRADRAQRELGVATPAAAAQSLRRGTPGSSSRQPRAEACKRLRAPPCRPMRRARVNSPVLRSKTRLDAADEPVAAEDRQHVVAVLALRLRHVHLEPVAEVEERLGARRGRGSAGRTARATSRGRRPARRRRPDAHATRRSRAARRGRGSAARASTRSASRSGTRLRLGVPALGEIPERAARRGARRSRRRRGRGGSRA